jgi:hypothetical protein
MNGVAQLGGTAGYADDATAASNGVSLGQLYHNAGEVRIRVV